MGSPQVTLLDADVADLLNEKGSLKKREHLVTKSSPVPGWDAPEVLPREGPLPPSGTST